MIMVSLIWFSFAIHRTEVSIIIGKLANSISFLENQNTDKNITRGNFYPYDNDIWRKIQWCPTGTVVIGMANKLDFGKFDNAGITDICSYCGRPEDDRTKKTYSAWGMVEYHFVF